MSHETIYRSPFIQGRGVLKKELLERLRAKHTVRRSKHAASGATVLARLRMRYQSAKGLHLLSTVPCDQVAGPTGCAIIRSVDINRTNGSVDVDDGA